MTDDANMEIPRTCLNPIRLANHAPGILLKMYP